MAVPKNKRYKAIVKSRRSSQKLKFIVITQKFSLCKFTKVYKIRTNDFIKNRLIDNNKKLS